MLRMQGDATTENKIKFRWRLFFCAETRRRLRQQTASAISFRRSWLSSGKQLLHLACKLRTHAALLMFEENERLLPLRLFLRDRRGPSCQV